MTVSITFLGHATWWLEMDGHKILIDPFLNDNPLASTDADSLDPEFIVISHGHFDHVADVLNIAERTGAKVIANWEIGAWLMNQGLENVHQQHIGGGYTHEFGHLKFTMAMHGSGLPDGSDGGSPAGLIFTTASGKKIYFLCDTALFSDLALYSGPDVALFPIGDNFTMGPGDALEAVKLVKPGTAIPCHFNTFPPIEQDGEKWAADVTEQTDAEGVHLNPGETFTLEE